MKTLSIIAIIVAGLFLTGCVFVRVKSDGFSSGKRVAGNGVITEKTFDVTDFTKIELNVPADVEYTCGAAPSMTVKVDENLLEYITVEVKNGTLEVASTIKSFKNFKKLSIELASSSLESLESNGAIDFEAANTITAESFKLRCNGAADVDIERLDVKDAFFEINGAADLEVGLVDADSVELNVNGAGDADLSGKTKTVTVKVHGAGDVDLSELAYESLQKEVNGIGSVKTSRK